MTKRFKTKMLKIGTSHLKCVQQWLSKRVAQLARRTSAFSFKKPAELKTIMAVASNRKTKAPVNLNLFLIWLFLKCT